MKNYKIILLCLSLISICPVLNSQDKVSYRYDAAGNRISRTIIFSSKSSPTPVKEEQPVVYSEMLSGIELKIYPNPTEGLLQVEIRNLPKDKPANIWIYDLSGKLISSFKDVGDNVSIDISSQPAGMYVMRIVAGEQRTEWKIIKK